VVVAKRLSPAIYLPALSRRLFATLPRYLLSNQGTEYENFDSVAEWTVDQVTAEDNATAGEFRSGTGSIKLTTGVGAYARIRKQIALPNNKPRAKVMVYLYAADIANINRISYMFSDNAYANYIDAVFVPSERTFRPGWNTLEENPDKWSLVGSASATYTRFRITLTPNAGTTCTMSVDSLVAGQVGAPAVCLSFDDADDSVYDEGYAYMKTKRARGTFYINTALPGTAGQVTWAQLQEMDAAGWAMGNHSNAVTDLTTLTEAQVETALLDAQTTLESNSLTKASTHVAYPSDGWNATVDKAMGDASMLTGRRVQAAGGRGAAIDANFDNKTIMHLDVYIEEATTLASITAQIDNALTYKRVIYIMTHGIGVGQISVANFRAMIDYAVQRKVPFVTIKDIWDSLSGPVTVPMLG
jgi:peptidoglycan/xylan/chitin deacetylase (PgdA/CDA1 family)